MRNWPGRAGVSSTHISNLVRDFSPSRKSPGGSRPGEPLVARIAKALGVSEDEARLAAGYAPSGPGGKPRNVAELVAALDRLGIPGLEFIGAHAQDELTPDDFEHLLRDIQLVVRLSIERDV